MNHKDITQDRIEGAGADNDLVKPVPMEELGSLLRNMPMRKGGFQSEEGVLRP